MPPRSVRCQVLDWDWASVAMADMAAMVDTAVHTVVHTVGMVADTAIWSTRITIRMAMGTDRFAALSEVVVTPPDWDTGTGLELAIDSIGKWCGQVVAMVDQGCLPPQP